MKILILLSLAYILFAQWVDCEKGNLLTATKCTETDLDWDFCYSGKACFLDNLKDQYLHLQFYLLQKPVTALKGSKQIELALSSESNSTLVFLPRGTKLSLLSNYIFSSQSTETCASNCGKCASDSCEECREGYFLYNFECVSDGCFNQLQELSAHTMTSNSAKFENGVYELAITLNVPLGSCLTPQLYLASGLLDNRVLQVLPFKLQGPRTVKASLPFREIEKQCRLIDLPAELVYQCLVGLAVTFNKVAQYNLLLVSDLHIDKVSRAALVVSQGISLEPGTEMEVEILNKIESVRAEADKITVVQIIEDPLYTNGEFELHMAEAKQGAQVYTLRQLGNVEKSGGRLQFTLKCLEKGFKPLEGFNLSFVSVSRRGGHLGARMVDRSKQEAVLEAKASYTVMGGPQNSVDGAKQGSAYWFIIGVTGTLILIISGVAFKLLLS